MRIRPYVTALFGGSKKPKGDSTMDRKHINGSRFYETPMGEMRSVTSYLDYTHKPGLVPWAAKLTAEHLQDYLHRLKAGEVSIEETDIEELVTTAKKRHEVVKQDTADVGTQVHRYVENYYSFGGFPDDPELRRLVVEAVSSINGKLGMKVDATEQMVFHPDGFAGTLDLLGTAQPAGYKSRKRSILDLKTGARVYPTAYLQVAAYAHAVEWGLRAEGKEDTRVELAIILLIKRDTGTAGEPIIMRRAEWRKHYVAFRHLVKYVQAMDSLKKK